MLKNGWITQVSMDWAISCLMVALEFSLMTTLKLFMIPKKSILSIWKGSRMRGMTHLGATF